MRKTFQMGLIASLSFALVGCSSMPGTARQQGAVVGGATGAAVGAAATENRALGAVIGGAVGAAGGYVIGAQTEKLDRKDSDGAEQAAREAEIDPAAPEDVKAATTADLNKDGFITLDEVVALEQAGLSDDEILQRLRATDQIFDLTEEQKLYLLDKGVSQTVVEQLPTLNESKQVPVTRPADSVISKDRTI